MLRHQQSFGEPCGQLKIFRDRRQGVLRQLDHQRVVRRLPFGLPIALSQVVVLPAGFPYFVVDQQFGVVMKIDAAGIFTGNRSEDIFAEGHSGSDLTTTSFTAQTA